MDDTLLLELIEYEKNKATECMCQLRHLKVDISPIEDIVKVDKEFSMHTYAFNCLIKLRKQINNKTIKPEVTTIDNTI